MESDIVLLRKARSGDESAMTLLSEKYMSYAREKAKRYVSPVLEYDDAVQECMIGFLSAFVSFREDGGASFKTYAGVCMDNRAVNAVNSRRGKTRIPPAALVDIENLDGAADLSPDPEKIFFLRAQTDEVLEKIQTSLSDFEKAVLSLSLSGYSYEEIGKMTSSSVKSVDNAVQRVRKKLKV